MATNTPAPANQDRGASEVLEEAFSQYQESGLRLPPVPRELIGALDEFSDWYWGSDTLDPMDVDGFLEAARQSGGEAEVAFGHAGHGVSSWWLCYRLKLDAVAVFIRQAYGGVYNDNAAVIPEINAANEALESLIPAAEAAKKAGRFQGGNRLIVVLDELGGNFWEIAGGDGKQHRAGDPIAAALKFLSQPVLRNEA